VERHLPGWLLVNWDVLRQAVRDFLLSYEPEVVAVLRDLADRNEPRRVGLGFLDSSLAERIRRYENHASTVSEFMFLLRGGGAVVRQDLDTLADEGRADVPVLYAAIEQIAGFERSVTPEEAAAACSAPSAGERLPAADPSWVREVFESQCRRSRMQRVRTAYTTVHRDWARTLIGAAIGSDRCRGEVERLLARDLNLRSPSPMRLALLWSWLFHEEHGGPFIHRWAMSQPWEDWAPFVGGAARAGLEDVGVVAVLMHRTFMHKNLPKVIRLAFTPHEEVLAVAVAASGPRDWYSLRDLFMALDHSSPELAARIVQRWTPAQAARTLEETDPVNYSSAWWFFSGVGHHSRAWCDEVGRSLCWEKISGQLANVSPGDAESVKECHHVLENLRFPLRRSMLRRLIEAARSALDRGKLSEFRVGFWFTPLWFVFRHELAAAVSTLDPDRIAKELCRSTPREWRQVADLRSLFMHMRSPFFEDLVDRLDTERFVANVRRHGHFCPYELRCLVWTLARGRQERRRFLGEQLLDLIASACRENPSEAPDLLAAFSRLHPELGARMAKDLGAEPRKIADEDKEDAEHEKAFSALRARIAELDRSGEDYEIALLFREEGGNEAR